MFTPKANILGREAKSAKRELICCDVALIYFTVRAVIELAMTWERLGSHLNVFYYIFVPYLQALEHNTEIVCLNK